MKQEHKRCIFLAGNDTFFPVGIYKIEPVKNMLVFDGMQLNNTNNKKKH